MPSLFDIAKSGVQSYRQALAVTGQNIANINTDGYKRREAGLTEVSSGQGGITQIQDGTGLGVRVEEIKRSFDAYLLDRKRNSFSREETATNFLDKSTWFLAGILLILILVTNSLINFPDAINESSLLDNNIINEEITESFIDEVPENQENINN